MLQFTESDVVKKKEERLLEMRFFIPDTEEQSENEVAAQPHCTQNPLLGRPCIRD